MKNKKVLRTLALMTGVMMCIAGCSGSGNSAAPATAQTAEGSMGAATVESNENANVSGNTAAITLQVGFENSMSEPFGQGLQQWKELLASEGDGSLAIELYPDSQLGDKSALIDSMTLGEGVCTLADGAFYADYGVNDFGIVFGPFLFDSWDDCWKLTDSDWYAAQCALLEEKGLHIIASNWVYGERHTLTTKPVNTVDDLSGLKVRVPTNEIQTQ